MENAPRSSPIDREGWATATQPAKEVERFGIRHMMIWMLAIALTSSLYRFFQGLEQLFLQRGTLEQTGLRDWIEAWIHVGLTAENARKSLAGGSVIGLGFLVLRGRSSGTDFWREPARVIFALTVALTSLEVIKYACLFGWVDRRSLASQSVEPISMGVASTAFVWTLYTALRCRFGWIWRLAIFFLALAMLADVFFVGAGMVTRFRAPLANPGGNRTWSLHLVSFAGLGLASITTFALAVVMEVTRGKYRSWQTWCTLAVPASILLLYWEFGWSIIALPGN